MNSTKEIIDYLNNLEEVKRFKKLEEIINNNSSIKNKLNELNDIKKKMVNSKEFNQINQYSLYKKEYDNIYKELIDMPFIEEYFELKEYVYNLLTNLKNDIEYQIEDIIKG